MIASLCLLLLLNCYSIIYGRPTFKPLGGLNRLRMPSTYAKQNNTYSDTFHHKLDEDDYLHFSYNAEKHEDVKVVLLDEELNVDSVICDSELNIIIETTFDTLNLFTKINQSNTLLSGGLEWGCMESGGKITTILRKILYAKLVGKTILVQTEIASHQDYFKTLNIVFSSTKFPKPQDVSWSHINNIKPSKLQRRNVQSLTSFFSDVWQDITDYGDRVYNTIKNVVTPIVDIAEGSLPPYNLNYTFEDWNWNSNSSFPINDVLTCSNCKGDFQLGVDFQLMYNNYQLQSLSLVAYGNVFLNIEGTVQAFDTYTDSGNFPVTAFVTNIPFSIGPIPFLLTFTLPINAEYQITLSGSVSVTANIQCYGSIQYGIQYDGNQWSPVNVHQYDQYGQISNLNFDVSLNTQLGLVILPTLEIDHIGYINFDIKPYIELSLDYSTYSGCGQDGQPGFRTVLNWGLEATVGAGISIPIIGLSYTFTPVGLAHIKKPIISGCSGSLEEDIISGPVVYGSTWHGWQIPQDNCPNNNYPFGNITFQLINGTLSSSQMTFVVSSSFTMPDSTWCIVQALYKVAFDDQGNIYMSPWTNGPYAVGFYECQSPNWSFSVSDINGNISDDNWDTIVVITPDNCAELVMIRN